MSEKLGRWITPDRLFVLVTALCVPLLFYMQRDTGPHLDEWTILKQRDDLSLKNLFDEYSGHLMFWTNSALELDEAIFGTVVRWPLRILSVASHVALVTAVYAYMRTRIDRWISLMVAVFLLTMGTGWEIIAWTFSFGWMVAMAAGVAALMVYERDDSARGRAIACGLLFFGLLGSGAVYPFIGGIALQALYKERRRRALAVAGPPAVFAAIYFLLVGRTSGIPSPDPRDFPGYALDIVDHSFGAIFANPGWGAPLAVAAVASLLYALGRIDRLRPAQLTVLAMPVIFIALVTLSRAGLIPADASRYSFSLLVIYPLVLAEFAQGWGPNINVKLALALIVLVACATNLKAFADNMNNVRTYWDRTQLYLVALERSGPEIAARSTFHPDFPIAKGPNPFLYDWVTRRGGRDLLPTDAEIAADPAATAEVQRLMDEIEKNTE